MCIETAKREIVSNHLETISAAKFFVDNANLVGGPADETKARRTGALIDKLPMLQCFLRLNEQLADFDDPQDGKCRAPQPEIVPD